MRENTPNMVGVDISKSHLDAHRLRTGEAARFGNDAAGFEELAGWIGAADRVVHEATGRCHRAFEEALAGAGLPLARANPLRARRSLNATTSAWGRGRWFLRTKRGTLSCSSRPAAWISLAFRLSTCRQPWVTAHSKATGSRPRRPSAPCAARVRPTRRTFAPW